MRSKALTNRGFGAGPLRTGTRAVWIAFGLFVLAAGSNGVAIRLSILELPPFWSAAGRFALAALLFWGIVAVQRIPLPRGRALTGVLVYGFLGVGITFAFSYWALVHVEAGMAMVFLGLVPMATVILAAAHGLEALRRRRVLGTVLAAGGIAVVAGGGLGQGLTLPVLLALLGFPLAMAEATVLLKLFPPVDPLANNAISLSVGAALLAGLSLLAGERWMLPAEPATWAAFIYLVVIGSLVVFYLWLFILGRWPATRTAYGFVLLPVVGVTVSVLVTGENLTLSFLAGAAVALLGVWVGATGRVPGAPVAQPAACPELAICAESVAQPPAVRAPQLLPCPEGADC
jgi:drug/metabolite transporter (DMT)-like permease